MRCLKYEMNSAGTAETDVFDYEASWVYAVEQAARSSLAGNEGRGKAWVELAAEIRVAQMSRYLMEHDRFDEIRRLLENHNSC